MLSNTMAGLAIAVIVISSVAWVSQFKRIRNRMRVRKAHHAQQGPAKETR